MVSRPLPPTSATPPPPNAPQPADPRAAAQQFITRTPVASVKGAPGAGTMSSSLLPNDVVGREPVKLRGLSEMEGLARKARDRVATSSERIRQIYQAGRGAGWSQAGRNGALGAVGPGVSYGNMQNAGRAWSTDGKLSNSRNSLLKDASSYLGSRWVLGGRSYQGIDCSGLVMNVYNKLGFNITQHSAGWQGRNIPGVRTSIANLRPGDIVAWKDGSHIAIYAGNGEIIEAANARVGTVRRRIWADPSQIYGIAVRLPGE